jgi:two-component system alkaline phosphatase synthesis response regulator PhoP
VLSERSESKHILVVDDERRIAEIARDYLERAGYRVTIAGNGVDALGLARTEHPDLIVLDLGLPHMDGLDVTRALRKQSNVPIIMLTARVDESDKLAGLELGADDYVTKPFSPKELVARVRALFRRLERKPEDETPIVRGRLEVDRLRHIVRWEDKPVHLTAKEFALLVALLEAQGRVLSRQALLEDVWGYSYAEGTRTVDVHVRRLRAKLGPEGERILTVKNVGYRLDPDG